MRGTRRSKSTSRLSVSLSTSDLELMLHPMSDAEIRKAVHRRSASTKRGTRSPSNVELGRTEVVRAALKRSKNNGSDSMVVIKRPSSSQLQVAFLGQRLTKVISETAPLAHLRKEILKGKKTSKFFTEGDTVVRQLFMRLCGREQDNGKPAMSVKAFTSFLVDQMGVIASAEEFKTAFKRITTSTGIVGEERKWNPTFMTWPLFSALLHALQSKESMSMEYEVEVDENDSVQDNVNEEPTKSRGRPRSAGLVSTNSRDSMSNASSSMSNLSSLAHSRSSSMGVPLVFYSDEVVVLATHEKFKLVPIISKRLPMTFKVSSRSVLPKGLVLNEKTGAITGRPLETQPERELRIQVIANPPTLSCVVPLHITIVPSLVVEYPSNLVLTAGVPVVPFIQPTSEYVKSFEVQDGSQLPAGLVMDSKTGIISGTPEAPAEELTVTIVGKNESLRKDAPVVLNIMPQLPTFSYKPLQCVAGEKFVCPVVVTNTTLAPISRFEWSPANQKQLSQSKLNLSVDATTGEVTGVGNMATEAGVVIVGSNRSGQSSATMRLTILRPAPQVTYRSEEFKFTGGIVVDSASTRPQAQEVDEFTLAPDSAPLPLGLSIDSYTGEVKGTPSQLTASPVRLKIRAKNNRTFIDCSMLVSVVPKPPAFYYTPVSVKIGANANIAPVLKDAALAPAQQFKWTSSNPTIEADWQLDAQQGVVRGKASRVENMVLEITAFNISGQSTEKLELVVLPLPPTVTYRPLEITAGQEFKCEADIPTTAGNMVDRFEFSPATFNQLTQCKASVIIDPTSGIVHGSVPAVMQLSLEIVVSNKGGSANSNLKINVLRPLPTVKYPSTIELTAGMSVDSQGIQTAPQATEVDEFSLAPDSAALPAGLSLNARFGGLCGTPVAPLATPVTLKIRCKNTRSVVDGTVQLSVRPGAPSFSYTNLSTSIGSFISTVPTVANPIAAPVTKFSIGNLDSVTPPVAFDEATGIFSGTPTAECDMKINVVGSNATGSFSYTWGVVVHRPAPRQCLYQRVVVAVGSAVNAVPTVEALAQPLQFRLENPSTPLYGLSLNTSTGVISGSLNQAPSGLFSIRVVCSNPYGSCVGAFELGALAAVVEIKRKENNTLLNELTVGLQKADNLDKCLQQVSRLSEEEFKRIWRNQTVSFIEETITSYHNTQCIAHPLILCHENCSVTFTGDPNSNAFSGCCAMTNMVCTKCGCSAYKHYHSNRKYVQKQLPLDRSFQLLTALSQPSDNRHFVLTQLTAARMQNLQKVEEACKQMKLNMKGDPAFAKELSNVSAAIDAQLARSDLNPSTRADYERIRATLF